VIAPHHGFGVAFLSTAIRSDSPANPLSDASSAARETSMAVYRDVVEGARPAVTPRLRAVLPDLLWLCHLGVTLFWVTDASPGQVRTRRLVDATVPLVSPLIRMARLPWGAGAIDQMRAALGIVLDEQARR
jgi:hypothetical protein